MDREDALREEQHRIRRLRLLVDVTAQILADDDTLQLCEALRLVDAARQAALRLFPDKQDTFEIVIRPRLERIVMDRFGIVSLVGVN